MRRRLLLFSLPALGILPLPPILFPPPPPAPVPEPVPAMEITRGVALQSNRTISVWARCNAPEGSTCSGTIRLSHNGRRLSKIAPYPPRMGHHPPLSAGEEASLQVRLRDEYERPAGVIAHITVLGGKQASR